MLIGRSRRRVATEGLAGGRRFWENADLTSSFATSVVGQTAAMMHVTSQSHGAALQIYSMILRCPLRLHP